MVKLTGARHLISAINAYFYPRRRRRSRASAISHSTWMTSSRHSPTWCFPTPAMSRSCLVSCGAPCLRNLWILSCGAISGFGLTGPRAAVLLAPTRIGQQTYLALAKLLRSSRPPGEPCFSCRGGA